LGFVARLALAVTTAYAPVYISGAVIVGVEAWLGRESTSTDVLVGLILTVLYVSFATGFFIALAAYVRRLHDFGRSGWWILLNAVPLAGFVMLYAMVRGEGDGLGVNDYGPPPGSRWW